MANIKFSYLYRDGGNYKKYQEVVFSNPDNIGIENLKTLIQSKLIDGMYFYVNEWILPDLHLETWDSTIDHTFHEFESVTYTEQFADFFVSLREWTDAINAANHNY
jgi:hypothetical protein